MNFYRQTIDTVSAQVVFFRSVQGRNKESMIYFSKRKIQNINKKGKKGDDFEKKKKQKKRLLTWQSTQIILLYKHIHKRSCLGFT